MVSPAPGRSQQLFAPSRFSYSHPLQRLVFKASSTKRTVALVFFIGMFFSLGLFLVEPWIALEVDDGNLRAAGMSGQCEVGFVFTYSP